MSSSSFQRWILMQHQHQHHQHLLCGRMSRIAATRCCRSSYQTATVTTVSTTTTQQQQQQQKQFESPKLTLSRRKISSSIPNSSVSASVSPSASSSRRSISCSIQQPKHPHTKATAATATATTTTTTTTTNLWNPGTVSYHAWQKPLLLPPHHYHQVRHYSSSVPLSSLPTIDKEHPAAIRDRAKKLKKNKYEKDDDENADEEAQVDDEAAADAVALHDDDATTTTTTTGAAPPPSVTVNKRILEQRVLRQQPIPLEIVRDNDLQALQESLGPLEFVAPQDQPCPEWQNPLHHNNPDLQRIFPEDFPNGVIPPEAYVQMPPVTDVVEGSGIYAPQNVIDIVDDMLQLNILEMAALHQKICVHFGFPYDDPLNMGGGGRGGGGAGGAAAAAAAAAEPEVVAPAKTKFDLKLVGFDEKSKIKVIKEVRAIAGLGLKEAKETVEGVPKIISKDLKAEDAEALKKKLEDAGAIVEIV